MSLRSKFILALGTIVSVLLAVTVFSLLTTWRTQDRVAGLTDVTIAEFERGRFLGEALEIEGTWSAEGVFVATEIELLPHPRRPKLRSQVQSVDVAQSRIWMLGMPILIDESTQFDWDGSLRLDQLAPGQRLEVSCEVQEDGIWRARKIRREGIKGDDKLKGVVTSLRMDGTLPDTLEISGLRVLLTEQRRPRDARTQLRMISLATRLSLISQDCSLAGQHVLQGVDESMLTRDGDYLRADDFLRESIENLGTTVELIRSNVPRGVTSELESSLWVERIEGQVEEFAHHAEALLGLNAASPAERVAYHEQSFEPFLMEELQPTIHSYLMHAEESLVDEVTEISAQGVRTTKVLLLTSVFAILVAVMMAGSLWRSVSEPLRALRNAAEKIGEGHFGTRTEFGNRDEFGVLGEAMNDMAAQLAATTVSLSNLDDIFDSMASALFVVDLERKILSANSAALELLGYDSLIQIQGIEFQSLLAGEESLSRDTDAPERMLRRADGQAVAVVLAEASLKGGAKEGGGFVYAAQDLTDRLAMEERLRVSLAEKDLLLREVHHRVKNNLQVISSLLALQATQLPDPQTRAVFAECQSRIRSMAMIHQQLYSSTDVAEIDLAAYLEQLVHALYQSHASANKGVTLDTQLDSAWINLDQALACGLILNELVTNSLKHAFGDAESGTIMIQTRVLSGNRVRLVVSDDGIGLDGSMNAENSSGLGTRLVHALVEQIDGSLEVANAAGVCYSIEFPLDQVAAG